MTNDDKDLKLKECPFCGCNSIAIRGFVCVCRDCGAQTSDNETKEYAIKAWNSRATPQQPSEPLKGLDKECLCYGAWGESHPDCPIHSLEAKFGQPSEKKALSVKDIESIIETTAFNQGESFIDKKPYAQAIHSALPAQREVRYPEKLDHDHSCEFDCKGCISNGWNQAINKMRKLNGDKT